MAAVNHADKASVIAAGISEAINCAAPGVLVMTVLLAAKGIIWLRKPKVAPPPPPPA